MEARKDYKQAQGNFSVMEHSKTGLPWGLHNCVNLGNIIKLYT